MALMAQQVCLDHAAVVAVLVGSKGAEQHDAGVVDEYVGAARLGLLALRRRHKRIAVGYVRLDGDGSFTELVAQGLDAVGTARQQGDAESSGGEGPGGRFADAR